MKNKVVLVLSFALMLSAKLVFAWTEKSDKQVAEAWEAWPGSGWTRGRFREPSKRWPCWQPGARWVRSAWTAPSTS